MPEAASRKESTVTHKSLLRIAPALLVGFLPLAASAEDYGGCFRVDLATPFVLPDGSQHAAGELTVCTDRPLNPAAGTHRMAASGRTVGRLVSRRIRSEIDRLERPQAVFSRDANGLLRLIGYAEPTEKGVRTFAFAAPPAPPADVVLLAAR
jgi:hypothetical protein